MVASKVYHIGWSKQFWINFDVVSIIQADAAECNLQKLLHTMGLSSSDHVVIRFSC